MEPQDIINVLVEQRNQALNEVAVLKAQLMKLQKEREIEKNAVQQTTE